MKGKYLTIAFGGALLVGIAVWLGSPKIEPVAVPVLQSDGSIGGEFAQQPSLLASMNLPVFDRPGVKLTFYHPNETNIRIGSSQTDSQALDIIVFHCPPGTSIKASDVFSRFPTGEDQWLWGPYLGSTGPNGASGDEGTRLQNWEAAGKPATHSDHPDLVFPDKNGGAGNKFGGRATGFSFVNPNYVLGPGRYVASARPPAGQYDKVRCAVAIACGNGFVDPGEQCDDGNTVENDLCTSACATPRCGDGIVQTGEQCDDGNTVAGDGCNIVCQLERCGNSVLDAGEQCDDGNTINTDACTNTCTLARCGDGFVQAGEQCDDGNAVNTDACTNTCANARCGDGIVRTGVEQCDDGNTSNTDSCTNTCTLARCGDGFVQAGEQCDDGNTSNTDACLNGCILAACGDGFVNIGVEQCDDGQTCMGLDANSNPIGDRRWCTTTADCGSQPIGVTCANHFNPAQIPPNSAGDGCRNNCTKEDGFACRLVPDKTPGVNERSFCEVAAP
jgi:cysteine-rich repeat protein